MHKPRKTHIAFNPEKFLAHEANKKAEVGRRLNPLREVIVLADDFKEALYVLLQKERPELFGAGGLQKYVESIDVLEDFLKRCLAKLKIKVSEQVFDAVYHDFVGGFLLRSSKDITGGESDTQNA